MFKIFKKRLFNYLLNQTVKNQTFRNTIIDELERRVKLNYNSKFSRLIFDPRFSNFLGRLTLKYKDLKNEYDKRNSK